MVAINALLTSLKVATDIAKAINGVDVSVEKAELKYRVAELINALADTKLQVVEVRTLLQEKDKEIEELEVAFELKKTLIRFRDAYHEVDENGQPSGDPYCSHCWEARHRAIHLYQASHFGMICPACNTAYEAAEKIP